MPKKIVHRLQSDAVARPRSFTVQTNGHAGAAPAGIDSYEGIPSGNGHDLWPRRDRALASSVSRGASSVRFMVRGSQRGSVPHRRWIRDLGNATTAASSWA